MSIPALEMVDLFLACHQETGTQVQNQEQYNDYI
jgi:hypothetical protein